MNGKPYISFNEMNIIKYNYKYIKLIIKIFVLIFLLLYFFISLNYFNFLKSINYYSFKKKNIKKKYIINNSNQNLKLINENNYKIQLDAENDYLKSKFKEEIEFLKECLNNTVIEKFEKYDNPKLSILIPFYNSEKYLNRLLRSIQKQKLRELEIIFVEDCSTDKGLLLLEKYSKLDKRIVIVKNKVNKGNLFTYVKAILSARAKHLLIIDADDMMLSKLKEQYEISQKNDKDINDFSFIEGTINMIKREIIIKDSEKYQPEIGQICYRRKYPCPCFITKKIIKTSVAVKAVKTINKIYLNSHILLYADTTLFITIFENSNSYQSYSSLFNQFYINTPNSITKFSNNKQNQIFNDALYFSQYIYELNYTSKEIFNSRIMYAINSFNWPLVVCKNNVLNINIDHLNKIISMFLTNININEKNKERIKLLIKNIKKKLNKTLIIENNITLIK